MSAKFDEDAHNGSVSIMFTRLLPYISIVTLTFDLWPPESKEFIFSPWSTCLQSLKKMHTRKKHLYRVLYQLKSSKGFLTRSQKCEKMVDGQTDDRQSQSWGYTQILVSFAELHIFYIYTLECSRNTSMSPVVAVACSKVWPQWQSITAHPIIC